MHVTEEDLEKALAIEPNIVSSGIGVPYSRRMSHKERERQFAYLRRHLLHSLKEFQVACAFLAFQKRTKNINENAPDSYRLKHLAEDWGKETGIRSGYISNGALIAAAIHLGFDYRTYPMSPNVHINITKKIVH